jgi:hypothetical protein
MSNQLAIAAVTRSIQSMLLESKIETKTFTPDRAGREQGNFINLFLYHTMHNAAWRNQDIPGRVRKSERGNPPLALSLFYLLTAYGEDGANLADQQMLGAAMRVLHDRPILKSQSVRNALKDYRELASSELADQIDKVRIVPEYLDIENMSRLWTTFQTQYRVSAAYQASVVLIESKRPGPSALPVTKRGEDDQGIISDLGASPVIFSVEYRGETKEPALPAASVGSIISVHSANLPQDGITAVIRDPRIESSDNDADLIARLTPIAGGAINQQKSVLDSLIKFKLDENAGLWRAGIVSLQLEIKTDQRSQTTNAIPLAIAPKLLTSGGSASVVATIDLQDSKRLLTVSLAYPTADLRNVYLTLTNVTTPNKWFQIPANTSQTSNGLSPVFDISSVLRGEYWVRVRTEGIDSLLMRKSLNAETGRYQMDFDPEQRIQIP